MRDVAKSAPTVTFCDFLATEAGRDCIGELCLDWRLDAEALLRCEVRLERCGEPCRDKVRDAAGGTVNGVDCVLEATI